MQVFRVRYKKFELEVPVVQIIAVLGITSPDQIDLLKNIMAAFSGG